MAKPVAYIADHLRRVLVNGGSAPHSAGVQKFFKEEIQSRGWRTAELRQLARRFSKVIRHDAGLDYLVAVADDLFHGDVLEEKILAVVLVQSCVKECTAEHFQLFEAWLERVSTWADHDALVQYLIGPMMVAEPKRVKKVFAWAKSTHRWHRRAAAVALLRGTNLGMFFSEVEKITAKLLTDEDDMVQKGLGWLLRETARYDALHTMPLLLSIREKAPRLVLRTACERLSKAQREQVLAR
ncbi:MAG: DNA alkylation repair protein [Acidobacteriota bacterium]|nr:DNA alkylation repair protein [Acidobacteriota bacterium]